MENLVAHLPDMHTRRGGIFGLIILVSFIVATAAMVTLDWLWPAWTSLGQIMAIIIGFGWTGQFFWRRQTYRARWGDLAYQKAFRKHVLVGLPVIFAAIAHNAYLPGQRLSLGRAIFTFGFDNLAMLYVYFPDEGRMVESSIYAIIRHPVYAAVIRIGLALGLWRGTWFSIAFGLFMPIGLTLWLRWVEEPELIERFGPGYATYRRNIPAFWPRARDAGKFLQFLVMGR
jgi:protein-S-isoprenylcysteine O-methyltransferase Ste14